MNEKILKSIKRINIVLLILALTEFVIAASFGMPILMLIIDLLFIIPIILGMKKIKWNYFVSIWTMLKYNPVSGFFLIFLTLNMVIYELGRSGLFIVFIVGVLIILEFILGIILLVKTTKYFKSLKNKE